MPCENCINYIWDDEQEIYVCAADVDEDEFAALISRSFNGCPYFRNNDEYEIVRHQN